MDVVRPDAIPGAVKPAGGEAAEAAKGGTSFGEVMKGVEARGTAPEGAGRRLPQLEIREVPTLPPPNEAKVLKLHAEKKEVAESPGGIEKLTTDLQAGHHRLQELIEQLKTRTYSPQELLGIQAEMHDLQVQIEVTTKVVAEASASVRNLMQQQA
jgi:hypothetical protein